ncbi:GNAT family N-acetyltransferase [Arcobacter sp. FW59]|nr:GNAT family N-acetyltransferase [Arcobacter sp. FW59]
MFVIIQRVKENTQKITEEFLWKQYKLHYGDKINPKRYEELKEKLFKECENPQNAMFIALNKDKIIACISIFKYDFRIKNLQYTEDENIAEVSRCYVEEKYRRQGIGTKLFKEAINFAKKQKYEILYLHTHYFLSGGFDFWKRMQFKIILDEKDSWQTVHMEKYIN